MGIMVKFPLSEFQEISRIMENVLAEAHCIVKR